MSSETNDEAQVTTEHEAMKALAQVVMNQEQRIAQLFKGIEALQSVTATHHEPHQLHGKCFQMLEDELEGVKLREGKQAELVKALNEKVALLEQVKR
jgi:hypothetical protein